MLLSIRVSNEEFQTLGFVESIFQGNDMLLSLLKFDIEEF
jgi:hypothetical protein